MRPPTKADLTARIAELEAELATTKTALTSRLQQAQTDARALDKAGTDLATVTAKYDAAIVDGMKHCRALVEMFRAANETLHSARDIADDNGDQSTFDDLVQASKDLEKYGARIGNHLVSG